MAKRKPDAVDAAAAEAEAILAEIPSPEPALEEEAAPPKRRRKKRKATPVPETAIPPNEVQFWGRRLQGILNWIADLRGYPKVTDEQAQALGEPMARVVQKRAAGLDERYPEAVLLMALAPWISAAVQVEVSRIAQRRVDRPRGDSGADRVREDDSSQGFATPPFAGGDY